MYRAKYKNYIITATYTGEKSAPWSDNNYNHHKVTIRNTTTGKKTSFDFWASIMHPVLDSEYDVLNAFYCFVSDAISGLDSFEDFCSNFGYDTDSRKAEKTWKACKRAAAKFQRISADDIYNLANELSENYG